MTTTGSTVSQIGGTSTFRDSGGLGWDSSVATDERFNVDWLRRMV